MMVPAQTLNGNALIAPAPNCAAGALASVMNVSSGVLGARVFPNPTPATSLPLHGPFNLAGLASTGMCARPLSTTPKSYVFCHDYLNSVCKRKVCKYIHCSKEEEDVYRKTGVLPERLKFLADNGLSALANMHNCPQEIPVCRDYQRGFCERGDLCKFTHSLIDGSSSSKKNGADSSAKPLKRMSENSTTIEHDEMSSSVRINQTTTNSPKLAKLELEERPASPNFDSKEEVAAAIDEGLQEENRQLKEKLNQFSRQIEELSSRNQQLHTQNSRLKQAAEEILRCRKPFNGSQILPILKSSHQSLLLPHSISALPPSSAPSAGLCHTPLHPHPNHNTASPAAGPVTTAAAAVQHFTPQQYPNKLLCHQMTYNAALLSAALNPTPGGYAPAVLFTSQPFSPSWGVYDNDSQMQPAIIEEIHDQKPNTVYSG